MTTIKMKGGPAPWRLAMWGAIAGLLILPAAAMRLDAEGVNWTTGDFVFAGVLLGGAGLLVELAVRRGRNLAYQAGVCVAVLAGLTLIWITGAVGIIGSEDHPANLLYGLVLTAAAVGAVLARFRPAGMALAMGAAAAIQTGIGVAALIQGWGAAAPDGWRIIAALTGALALMWTAAALLFRRAGRNS